jgi:3-hydroxyisobutyrate dehydrogenase
MKKSLADRMTGKIQPTDLRIKVKFVVTGNCFSVSLASDQKKLVNSCQNTIQLSGGRMKVSVIGLGSMGAGIAGNLQRAGLLHGAWNRTRERGEEAAQRLAFSLSGSLQEAVEGAQVVITSGSADVDLGEMIDRLIPLLAPGSLVIDTSTVHFQTAIDMAAKLAESNLHFLDAPVSGGREGAEKGTMVMMVGGDIHWFEKMQPVFDAISSKAVYMGPAGSGQSTKAVNQIMVAGINQAVTDALAFAVRRGLDTEKVLDVIQRGAADNWFLRHRGQSMLDGIYEPGFRVALHDKDLKICLQMLGDTPSRLVEDTLQHYSRLIEAGFGDEDISALFRIKTGTLTKAQE